MVFRNGGKVARSERWYWGQSPLSVTSKYTYLGYPLTPSISFTQVALNYRGRAMAAMGAVGEIILKSKLKSFHAMHIPRKELLDADALSRQPLLTTEGGEDERPTSAHINAVLSSITDKDEMLTKIFEAQQEDTTLKAVVNYLEQGWPDKKKMLQALLSYWHVKDELGVQNGLLMRSCRLVIPASMKLEILDKLHAGHFGITKPRLRARETVWWPGISEEIAETVRKCSVCIQEAVSKHEPLIPTNFPTRPWQKIGMDLFKFENKWYLVVIDYYSRFPEIIQLDRLTANVVVRSCKSIFARHGIPETVVSDNGTQFGAAREFANFARQYGFTHVTSSPRFPQSNGMAEAGVKIANLILKKNQDPSLGLLEYRSTPLENGYSPAELLMGRKLRTTLPIAPENLNSRLVDSQTLKRKEGRRRKDMKSRYDRRCGATDMEELSEGDTVWIKDMRIWGIVKQKASTPRSYMVDILVGTVRRNRLHLRKGVIMQYPADPSTPTFSGEKLVENEKTPVVDYPSNDSEDGQIRTRKKRGGNYMSFFVDLRKAFDTVPHSILWKKLYNLGISYQFISTIRSYYEQATIAIRWKGSFTENIKINSGVLQGEPLSPLLFILFITDLIEIYNNSDLPSVNLPEFGDIHLLLYADDIAIIGESRMNLQKKIKILKENLDENLMTLNESKSKIMVFRNGGKPSNKDRWFWNDKPITITSRYTYLGFPLTPTITTTHPANYFKGKALTAINATHPILIKSKAKSINLSTKLFDTIVRAVLMYAAPLWATEHKDLLDSIQDIFIRRFLNLPRYTPGHIIRLETGRISLSVTALKLTLKYWLRVVNMSSDRLPRICFNRTRELSNASGTPIGFIKKLTNLLNNNGSPALVSCDDPETLRSAITGLLKTAADQSIQNDLTRMDKSKLYSHYKDIHISFMTEGYLLGDFPFPVVRLLAQVRILSSFFLENHTKMLCGEDPICTFCNSKLKNESIHYIFDCYALKEERRTLMLKTGQLCASLPSIIDNMTQNKYIATAFYGFHESISQKKAK
ncbi:K02A2.6-like [Cordylochernes scorpioides]|uniref:RNA-directed DNA polymerase n=1 Tax=Cordylochernes scorpioides TaxID=51811 RepID=A0ABY6K9I6_9ARAC|nr:K02A2.6-like [Cordylochernes scorpioides]